MQELYCHSCMLPFLHAAILACCRTWWLASSCNWWWVVICLQYITTSHVDSVNSVERWYGHKTETWYSEQKFMFTIMWNPSGFYVVDRLSNDIKMNSTYFVKIYLFHSNKRSFLEEWRRIKTIGGLSWQLLSSHKSDFNRLTWRTRHSSHATPTHPPTNPPTHQPYSSDLAPVIFVCFLQSKKSSNGFSWLTRTSFLNVCKTFWRIWINKNWRAHFRLECSEFKK
jgi:hypothetical protein